MTEQNCTTAEPQNQLLRDIHRCRREIAAIKEEILEGNPELPGLCLGLMDWSLELRVLEGRE